jgi:hypothetical protein
VSALQVTAEKTLGTTAFRGKDAQKEHMTQRGQQDNGHYSSNDTHIAAKQTSTQTLKDKLRQAREEDAPPNVIADLGKSHTKEKHELQKLQHQARQNTVTDAIVSSAPNQNQHRTSPHSMWDLLRRYKTDHVQSNLPAQTHDNLSPDARIWKLGPLTLDPQAWHRFRYALGHHLLKHAQSPYNEAAAHRVTTSENQTLHKVDHPTLPIDPLFHKEIELHELKDEIKKLNSDKSPGDDGITNRMLQAGGPKFQEILHEAFGMLWQHEIQPTAWQMSLMQPIYKGGDKSKADPASYRGIYLSSALAKLFEGILICRLTKFTEAHSTLTENQLGTRPGRQIHDAIYCLLSLIQYNISQRGLATYVAFCDFSTAFPSIHRGKLLSQLCKENIVGRMWKHLRERFHVVKVRVLHPRIPKSSSVNILRGVPEGSRLSPTLFGIFVADLIHELRAQFPNATITHNGGVRWIGGILYVDDLCLISTDAHELQRMINTCQTWSEKARMQLNADKTKVMCFHETTQARNARKRPRKVQGQKLWPASFHILSMFPDYTNPTDRPHQYPGFVSTLIQEVKQFDYLGLRLDPMMNMKAAVALILEKENKGHSLALVVSYSLRYDKHHSNPTLCSSPVEMLNLWKSCVLPHFLLYLRYISDESQVKTLQASLNRSLSTTLHVYGHPTALLADTGIPPLYITQNLQLAQLRFRLHSSPPNTIQHFLWHLWQPLLQVVPLNTLEDRMQTAICHVDPARRDPASPMPKNINLAKTLNKEKSYKKYLESQCSDQWRKHLELALGNPPGRVRAYVHWHLHNKHNRSLYKPAPYLTHQSCPYQLELLRIRTQHTVHIIPSQLHYAYHHSRADYQNRVCPHCLANGTSVLGDELHIICHCPATKVVLEKFTDKFQRLTRLLDLPPFATFTPEEMTRLVLGNPPPPVLNKDLKGWITEATPICGEFAYALRLHVTSLHPVVVDMSSDDDAALSSDDNDDFSPILLPPGFQPASVPPHDNMLVPLDTAGQQMIGQHILFKWPTYGWCFGKISAWNNNPKRKVGKQIVNFNVFYPDDSSSGPHCLSLDNYNVDADNDSPNHTWLLLEPVNP